MSTSNFVVCQCVNNIFLISVGSSTLVYKCTHCGKMNIVEINGNAD